MLSTGKVLVTGAGGFIGHHLVSFLKKQGYWVRGVDIKYPEYSRTSFIYWICVGRATL
jgi:GDP-D-mannose 3',5'-epimerase